jgi:hypothetical protein
VHAFYSLDGSDPLAKYALSLLGVVVHDSLNDCDGCHVRMRVVGR